MNSVRDNINDEFIMVIAQQNQMHVLPDSTKVWMESGSSIKYTKAFNKKREVWLEGNSFFVEPPAAVKKLQKEGL